MQVQWNSPDSTPSVDIGTEELFWLAIQSKKSDGTKYIIVRSALYQNRPLIEDEEGFRPGWTLIDPDCEHIDSVGWVDVTNHYEFDDFYEPIYFDDYYKLLGWAEYCTPEFNGTQNK